MRLVAVSALVLLGASCVLVPPDFIGYACDAEHSCDGQACVDGICVPRCDDDADCGAARACIDGGCVIEGGEGEGEPAPCDVAGARLTGVYEGHCYASFEIVEDFAAVAKRCARLGGTVAIPDTLEEEQFIEGEMMLSGADPYLGLVDVAVEGLLRSLSGAAVLTPGPYREGEPNDPGHVEDCLQIRGGAGWNDVPCFGAAGATNALCELPFGDDDFCGDGIVQPAFGEACDGDPACPADCSGVGIDATTAHVFDADTLYLGIADRLTFDDARAACQRLGADLAIPTSEQENNAVLRAAAILGLDVWIGYTDNDNAATNAAGFVRVDTGEPIDGGFDNFAVGEPSDESADDCVVLESSDGAWEDDACSQSEAFVCAF